MIHSRAAFRPLFPLLLLLACCAWAMTALAQPSVETGARIAGGSWVLQTVTRPTAPLTAQSTAGSGATAAWASCQPGTNRAQAASATGVAAGLTSGAYATFVDYYHLSSPYLGTNATGDFLYNLYLTGTMRIQANNSNSYATVTVSGNSTYCGSNGGMLSFGQAGGEAQLFAVGGEVGGGGFPMNNILAGPGGAKKIYARVGAPSGGYYTIQVAIPVRFFFNEFPINQSPPADDWSNRIAIGLNCVAWQGATSDFSSTFTFAAQNPIVPDPNDARLPLEDWTYTVGSGEFALVPPLSVACATGSGPAFFLADKGSIANLAALDGSTLPADGRPGTGFGDGFFDFDVTGLATGDTSVVTITLPGDQPIGTYWCYVTVNGWNFFDVDHDDGDTTVKLTLIDGGPGDTNAAAGAIHATGGLSPEQPQAVWLSGFAARARDHGVDLSWRAAGAAPGDFTLTARRGAQAWGVAVEAAGEDAFTARDEHGALAAGGCINYELRHDGDLAGECTIDLALPSLHAALTGALPNPFNAGTRITFTVPRTQRLHVAVYDLAGRRVAVLADREYGPGDHSVAWQGTGEDGRALPAGTYVVRLATEQRLQSRLVSLVR